MIDTIRFKTKTGRHVWF